MTGNFLREKGLRGEPLSNSKMPGKMDECRIKLKNESEMTLWLAAIK